MSRHEPQGDRSQEDHFRSIFESRYPLIHSYVLRRLGPSDSDVLDVTSQVFAVAWKRRNDIPGPPEDLPWLYGVARKIVSRHWRGAQRRQRLQERLAREAHVDAQSTTTRDPRIDQVRTAMGRLRERDREVLRLILWEQLTHAEVAEVLGRSVNAVGIRLHKARHRLETVLTADVHDDEPDSDTTEEAGESDDPR